MDEFDNPPDPDRPGFRFYDYEVDNAGPVPPTPIPIPPQPSQSPSSWPPPIDPPQFSSPYPPPVDQNATYAGMRAQPRQQQFRTPFDAPSENTSTKMIFGYREAMEQEQTQALEKPKTSYTTVLLAFMAALVGVLVGVSMNDQAATSEGPNAVRRPSYSFNVDEEDYTVAEVLTLTAPSVVAVSSPSFGSEPGGAGSGVIISSDGTVLTNAHVIGDNTVVSLQLYDGTPLKADLIGSYPEEDIALLQIENVPANLPVAELGNSVDAQVGDEVLAIGNTLNLGVSPTVTRGIVSGKDRTLQAEGGLTLKNLLQTDSAINPGNSGGPLVNSRGKVIGINTAIIPNANSVGFAIPIDSIKPLIESIRSGEGTIRSDQAFFGVLSRPTAGLTDDIRTEYGVDGNSGVFVVEIVPGAAAYFAGIKAGDVVLSVNGQPVESPESLASIVRASKVGETIEVVVKRNGVQQTVPVKLDRRGPVTP